jgi:class 3 adenylate cyclase
MKPHSEELILAVTHVLASTQICATVGDARMFELFSNYYALVANEVSASGGRVIKVMGDTTLLTFPTREPRAVVDVLGTVQAKANALWQQVDANSRVQVKAGIGEVVVGSLDQRLDIVGSALNRLFKAPWTDFEIMPELRRLI